MADVESTRSGQGVCPNTRAGDTARVVSHMSEFLRDFSPKLERPPSVSTTQGRPVGCPRIPGALTQFSGYELSLSSRRRHSIDESANRQGELHPALIDEGVGNFAPAPHNLAPSFEQASLTRLGFEPCARQLTCDRLHPLSVMCRSAPQRRAMDSVGSSAACSHPLPPARSHSPPRPARAGAARIPSSTRAPVGCSAVCRQHPLLSRPGAQGVWLVGMKHHRIAVLKTKLCQYRRRRTK
jgi:hypothetical protein